MSAEGTVLDRVPAVIPSAESVWYVRLASPTGGRTAVLWQTANRRAVSGMWTDTHGVLSAGSEFAVSVPSDHYLDWTYTHRDDPDLAPLRVRGRRFEIRATGGTCETGFECASGVCNAAVCD